MNDEGFREIQLNGKQLVFLFMAATVVSVVIFLCGVLVGRGVRSDRAPGLDAASADVAPDSATTQPLDSQDSQSTNSPNPVNGAARADAPLASSEPPPVADELALTYEERLKEGAPNEKLNTVKPAPVPAAAAPSAATTPPPAVPSSVAGKITGPGAKSPRAGSSPVASDPSGAGFAVQVAAYKDRTGAANLAKNLAAKGYPSFVMDPVKGAPSAMYRVRVGKYKTRKDAETVSARIESGREFKPWIVR